MGIVDILKGKSKEEKEIERKMAAKRGRQKMTRYRDKLAEMQSKLMSMGKEAVRIGEEEQLRQILLDYWWTNKQMERCRSSLLFFDRVEARRDLATSTRDFLEGLQAMGQSMMSNADPSDLLQMQKDLELGLARAENQEERMNLLLESADFMYDVDESDKEMLDQLRVSLEREAAGEASELDDRIAAQLRAIEEEMRH